MGFKKVVTKVLTLIDRNLPEYLGIKLGENKAETNMCFPQKMLKMVQVII